MINNLQILAKNFSVPRSNIVGYLAVVSVKVITLAMVSIAISLTIGLVLMQYGHGEPQDATQQEQTQKDIIIQEQIQLDNLKPLVDYCFQHADRPNPLQDLIDKGFLPQGFKETCKSVKQTYDKVQQELGNIRTPYEAYLVEQAMNNTKFNNCLRQDMSVELCYDTYIGNRPTEEQLKH